MSCELKIPPQPGLEDGALTVGRIFQLHCPVMLPEGFNLETAKLEIAENNKLTFKVFKILGEDKSTILIEGTFYRTGDWQLQDLVLTDGKQKVSLGKLEAKVQSVVPPDVKAEVYGPIGPLKIPIPWIYIFIIAVILLFLLGSIGIRLRRNWQRKSLLQRLREYETPLSPLQQFHAESRRWQRQYSFFHDFKNEDCSVSLVLNEINRQVRIYFIRRFQIPALEWNAQLILKDLKKYHRKIYDDNFEVIKKWFTEMTRALSPDFQLKAKDVIQLLEEARKMLEKLDRESEGKG